LKVVIMDDEELPLANMPYVLEIDGQSFTGDTDGQGTVQHKIPPNARKGLLTVGQDENRREYFLNLGHIDPVESVTGLQARLRNLGFYDGEVDGDFNAETLASVLIFQEQYMLQATGENDEATQAKLKQVYGC
jgi:peptidoglycan hydrolase-like protein with peptidoglycan-binding domain